MNTTISIHHSSFITTSVLPSIYSMNILAYLKCTLYAELIRVFVCVLLLLPEVALKLDQRWEDHNKFDLIIKV